MGAAFGSIASGFTGAAVVAGIVGAIDISILHISAKTLPGKLDDKMKWPVKASLIIEFFNHSSTEGVLSKI